MVNHGLITGALFLLVGVIYERTHDRTIAKMAGLSNAVPVYAAVLGFFVFASAGLPGLSGFVGEFLSLVGAYAYSPWVALIAATAMVLAAAYLLFMFQRLAFGDLSDLLRGLGHHLTDMSPVEILTLAPLGALVVLFGLFPGILLDLFAGSVDTALADVSLGEAAAMPTWFVAGVVGILAILVVVRIVYALATDTDRPGAAPLPVDVATGAGGGGS
jgi:NADH-quinone oxidoreductase subunit M